MSDATLNTAQIISLGDGRLAGPVGEIYEALNTLLDDNLMTHQLPDAGRYVEPHVIAACPWVTNLPELDAYALEAAADRAAQQQIVDTWVAKISAQHGETHQVPDPSAGWTRRDPIEQAADMFGADRVVVLDTTKQADQ